MSAGVIAMIAGASAACSGPDSGSISYAERSSSATGGDQGDTKNTTNATVPSDSGKNTTPTNLPFGDSKFAAGTPPNGPAKGKTTHTMNATNDPSGVECMACHTATFAFGGTVYSKMDGTGTRVAGAQVVVSGPDGRVFATAYSDADGNFWIDNTGQPMPAKSRVGVRDGTKSKVMNGEIGGAEGAKCNNATCHGNAALRVYLE